MAEKIKIVKSEAQIQVVEQLIVGLEMALADFCEQTDKVFEQRALGEPAAVAEQLLADALVDKKYYTRAITAMCDRYRNYCENDRDRAMKGEKKLVKGRPA